MNQAPNIISTKDLSYLEDIFQWNFNASKKAYHYSQEITNNEVKQLTQTIINMHNNICNEIINILGGNYDTES